MTKKRIATLATCLTLVGAVAVGGTLALLTSGPRGITNTFSTSTGYDDDEGEMDFIIEEKPVQQNTVTGSWEFKTAVTNDDYTSDAQNYINLVPNTTLAKNPRFELKDGAGDGTTPPDSWIVAKIDVEDAKKLNDLKITFSGSVGADWRIVKATATGFEFDDSATFDAKFLNTTYQNPNEGTTYYFIYDKKLSVDGEATTTNLFNQLSVAKDFDVEAFNEAIPDGSQNLPLEISGVAVQALADDLDGEGVLSQVMADAVAAFNAQ